MAPRYRKASKQQIALELTQLGAYKSLYKESSCCTTSLATSLCSCIATVPTDPASRFIIVETNCRIYGYTENARNVFLLNVFSHSKCLLPNLFIGVISAISCQRAFNSGISAELIIAFLKRNAYASTTYNTVAKHVSLWEYEAIDKFNIETPFR